MSFVHPMRPGIILREGIWPEGWSWQMKLDEERGILADGKLYNRRGQRMADHKERAFEVALEAVTAIFDYPVLDLGLIGFRDIGTWGTMRGAVVVFDLPTVDLPWIARHQLLLDLPPLPFGRKAEWSSPFMVYRLLNYSDPAIAFALSKLLEGCEGIVGRNPSSVYQPGDSREMAKCRWR